MSFKKQLLQGNLKLFGEIDYWWNPLPCKKISIFSQRHNKNAFYAFKSIGQD